MSLWSSIFGPGRPKPVSRFVRKVIWSMKTRPADWARAGDGFTHQPSNLWVSSYIVDCGCDDGYVETVMRPGQMLTRHEQRMLYRAYRRYLYLPHEEAKRQLATAASRAARAHFA